MRNQLTSSELQKRLDLRQAVEAHEVLGLLGGTIAEQREATQALYVSKLRESVSELARLAELESFENGATIELVRQLSTTAGCELTFLDMMQKVGVHKISEGRYDEGFADLQAVTNQGWISSMNRSDEYHLQLMSYMHDPQIDGALATIGAQMRPPAMHRVSREHKRIVLFVSTILGESSPTTVLISIARDLHARGYDVHIVSSEFWCYSLDQICQSLIDEGIPVERAPDIPPLQKVGALTGIFQRLQPDLVLYMVTPMDFVAKILSEVGVAPSQCMFNMAYEHNCGKFDFVLQTTSLEQERATHWPGKSKYVGSFAALEPRMLSEEPIDRARVQIPQDAIALVTHGRVSKCTSEYISAVGRILSQHPNTVLVLAGAYNEADLERFNTGLAQYDLGQRVIILGSMYEWIPSLLKACDVYLDPFPWPGGQSTLEAMWAGIPIVAMQGVERRDDDPDSYGPIGTATHAFLPEHVARAGPGDVDAYVNIATAYIRNTGLRKIHGKMLRDHVSKNYSFEGFMYRLDRYLQKAMQLHQTIPVISHASEPAAVPAETYS